jgi:hypothetical protein
MSRDGKVEYCAEDLMEPSDKDYNKYIPRLTVYAIFSIKRGFSTIVGIMSIPQDCQKLH